MQWVIYFENINRMISKLHDSTDGEQIYFYSLRTFYHETSLVMFVQTVLVTILLLALLMFRLTVQTVTKPTAYICLQIKNKTIYNLFIYLNIINYDVIMMHDIIKRHDIVYRL